MSWKSSSVSPGKPTIISVVILIFGIVLNLILPNEEEGKENIVIDENVDKKEITYNKEIDKLKEDIKNELTVSLKGEIIEEIKKELNKKKKVGDCTDYLLIFIDFSCCLYWKIEKFCNFTLEFISQLRKGNRRTQAIDALRLLLL